MLSTWLDSLLKQMLRSSSSLRGAAAEPVVVGGGDTMLASTALSTNYVNGKLGKLYIIFFVHVMHSIGFKSDYCTADMNKKMT
jgi:hypothetical protein